MKTRIPWMGSLVWMALALAAKAAAALSIRSSDTLGEELDPQRVAAFREQNPGCDVELESLGKHVDRPPNPNSRSSSIPRTASPASRPRAAWSGAKNPRARELTYPLRFRRMQPFSGRRRAWKEASCFF